MLLWILQKSNQAVLHLEKDRNWDSNRDKSGMVMKSLTKALRRPSGWMCAHEVAISQLCSLNLSY